MLKPYLGGRESKPPVEHRETDVDVATEFLLEQFRKILHHAFQSCWLFEIRPRLVLVLGVHEFEHDSLVLSAKGLGVGFESNDEVVGISGVGRVSGVWIGNVSLAISLRSKQRIQLVIFDIDHQALRRIGFVSVNY